MINCPYKLPVKFIRHNEHSAFGGIYENNGKGKGICDEVFIEKADFLVQVINNWEKAMDFIKECHFSTDDLTKEQAEQLLADIGEK